MFSCDRMLTCKTHLMSMGVRDCNGYLWFGTAHRHNPETWIHGFSSCFSVLKWKEGVVPRNCPEISHQKCTFANKWNIFQKYEYEPEGYFDKQKWKRKETNWERKERRQKGRSDVRMEKRKDRRKAGEYDKKKRETYQDTSWVWCTKSASSVVPKIKLVEPLSGSRLKYKSQNERFIGVCWTQVRVSQTEVGVLDRR